MIINKINSVIYTNQNTKLKNKNTTFQTKPLQQDIFIRNVQMQPLFLGKNIDFDVVKSLTEHLAKRPYSKKHAQKVCNSEAYEKAQGITGELPTSWTDKISDIKLFDKEAFCERFGEIFSIDRHWADIDVMTDSLRKLFKEHGIIQDESDLTTEFIGKGFFGRNFKISIGDGNDKVVKEFKRTYRYHNNHGNYSEQNLGEHFKKFAGRDTEMVPYYYGDTQNGILITKFISENSPNPTGKINLEDLGTTYDDGAPRNYVGNWIVDFGGLITINNLVGKPNAQKIFREFKYAVGKNDLVAKFENIFSKALKTDEKAYNEAMIGLTHSIRFLPEDIQGSFYEKMHNLGLKDVDIAILDNTGYFKYSFNSDSLLESIAKTDDIDVKKAICRQIKNFPSPLKDSIFENYSANETNQSIKKYLARNLNHYYRNIANRINIFDDLAKDADAYANIALINSLTKNFSSENIIDSRFERLFETGDIVTKSALARNIEIFNENPELLEKWLNKFNEIPDYRIKRGLAESVVFLPEEFQAKTFESLLDIQDNNTKEFLAEAITSIKGYQYHDEWIKKLLDGGDNSIRRSLAAHVNDIKYPSVKQKWISIILDGADSSVKKIIDKNN